MFDRFDLPILAFLTGFADKSNLFDHLVNALSRLDMFKGVALMCLFWYVWAEAPAGEQPHRREQRHQRLVMILIGTVLIGGLSRGLQLALPIHQRPVLSGLGLNFPVTAFDAKSINNWNSFPSDHMMFFFALGAGLWTLNRAVGAVAFIWTLLVIGFPRIYLGIHYPSDVIAGALFGLVGMKVFLALPLERIERYVGAWRQAHQGLFLATLFFATDMVGHLMEDMRELAHSMSGVLLH